MLKRKTFSDLLFRLLVGSAAAIVCLSFLAIVTDLLLRGAEGFNFQFLISAPEDAGRMGGISTVLVSTFLIVLISLIVAMPLGMGGAVFLQMFSKRGGFVAAAVRTCLDVLASTPSIVFGLFGSVFFCGFLRMGFSILSGGLTLACMVLPLVIRMTESGLSAVPEAQRMNACALGFSRTGQLFKVLLPLSVPTLCAAFVLGLARALSETAALLFTSGYVLRMPESLFDSGRSLSVHVFDLAMNVPGGDSAAARSALVLLLILLLLNSVIVAFTRRFFVSSAS